MKDNYKMDDWTKDVVSMLKQKAVSFKADDDPSWTYGQLKVGLYEYRKHSILAILTPDELETYLLENGRNLRQWRRIRNGFYKVKLSPVVKPKRKLPANIYTEDESIKYIDKHLSKETAERWLGIIFDETLKGKKFFLTYKRHPNGYAWDNETSYKGRSMTLRWFGDDFPHESTLTDAVMDKLVEVASR